MKSWSERFDDPDRLVCAEPNSYGYRCSLPIGHAGLHVALDTAEQPLDRWG